MDPPLLSNGCPHLLSAALPVPRCLDSQAFLALMRPDDPAIQREKRTKIQRRSPQNQTVMKEGKKLVPAYGKKLSDKEINDVIGYVRTFAGTRAEK